MTLLLDADQVRRAFTMPMAIERLREGLAAQAAGDAVCPPRLSVAGPEPLALRLMPALVPSLRMMGFKAFHTTPAGVRYMVCLFDTETGALTAVMDAHELTAMRTGAVTGLASDILAPASVTSVAVIGSGLEARWNLAGVLATRPVAAVRCFSPNPDRRRAFADHITDVHGIEATPCASVDEAVEGAELVVVATSTRGAADPIAFRARSVAPGVHLNAIGSTMPALRELDADVFARADRVVFDSGAQALEESGDVIAAVDAGHLDPATVDELPRLAAGPAPLRGEGEVTLFKSVGTGLQDLLVGLAVLDVATERGLGVDVGELLDLKVRPGSVAASGAPS